HVFLDGKPAATEVIRDKLRQDITYEGGEPDLADGYRFRDEGFKGGAVDVVKIFNRALTPIEIADVAGRDDLKIAWKTAPDALGATRREGLLDYYVANVYPPARQFLADLT